MTQRLDAGAGWYGEFLRRDPDGMRACLNGAAIPPWDVVESLLRDLAESGGAELAARETGYAAKLRATAVAVWDRLPGGADELRTLLAAAAAQRAESEEALRSLTARLGGTADRAETEALTRELSWTQDDMARAAARHEDLAARLAALHTAPHPGAPRQAAAPAQAGPTQASPAPQTRPRLGTPAQETPETVQGGARAWADPRTQAPTAAAGPGHASPGGPRAGSPADGDAPRVPGRVPGEGAGHAHGQESPPADEGGAAARETDVLPPVGRAEGRWLRGARRAGGARYAGSAAPGAPAFTPPPGHPDAEAPGGPGSPEVHRAPRGARFGRPRPERASVPEPAPVPVPVPEPAPAQPAGSPRAVAAELIALRAQGRSGEAHALLCQAAAWPAGQLPHLAAELTRAGLAADWTTLLWEAASLPPDRLAAAAAALGDADREADRDALLRQGVARPAAEVADAALALGTAGRTREAEALLGAFVRVRTAEEAAALARHDPQWLTPLLLRVAGLLPGARHRDLVHALRVAGIATPW
ncbi:hypothetical protein [Streptomyces sp. NPDC090021]|uniref:hypothetical protein n=1 Tax=Streptomyces sp. NPDC090021 TaxID=3365919 RepID=UPI003816EDCA